MMAFEWNALRVGDAVLLHHDAGDDYPLDRGVVAFVDGKRGENDVGVRLSAVEHHRRVVRPYRQTVHLDPARDTADCWRCGRASVTA